MVDKTLTAPSPGADLAGLASVRAGTTVTFITHDTGGARGSRSGF
jgi:hypothetical protein